LVVRLSYLFHSCLVESNVLHNEKRLSSCVSKYKRTFNSVVAPEIDVVSMWTMSQRFVSLSINLAVSDFFRMEEGGKYILVLLSFFILLGYWFTLPVYLFWFILSEVYHVQFTFLNRLSTRSLLMYILIPYELQLASRIVPKHSALFMMSVLFMIGFSADILILRFLEANNINVRL
jgi:hypothetical protein